jgi:outer membrane receptor protein involved in Fe transport
MRTVFSSHRGISGTVSTLALAVAGLLVSTPTFAQDSAEQAAPAPAEADAPAAPSDQASSAEIVVTGSRIARTGFSAPTPVTTVGRDRLSDLAASNIGDVLTQLPSFRASSSPSATQTNPGNTVGSRVLELRGLGAPRTLVLVNGRRFVPTTSQGTVDANYIPSILVQRAEVVTGGASAAYGSDAVAGVVNFILDSKLQGFRGEAQAGISERGDDATRFLSMAAGTGFAGGRGHVVIGGEYEDNEGLGECYTARAICAEEWSLLGNSPPGRLGLPALSILNDIHAGSMSPGGLITSAGPLKNIQFAPDGSAVPFVPGLLPGLFQQGGSGHGRNPFLSGLLLKVPVERFSLFGRADYEISDAIRGGIEVSYGEVSAYSVSAQLRDTGSIIGPVRRDNPYLPASVTAIMDANNISQFTMGRAGLDIGNAQGPSKSTAFRTVASLEGNIAGSWKWDAYYQYGRSTYSQDSNNNIIRSNIALAADAVRAPGGAIVCRSTLTNPSNGCQPINLIGENRFTKEALDYITGTSSLDLTMQQHVAALNVQGDLVELWAGPISLAAGYEYRRDTVDGTVDPISAAGGFYVSNFAASNGKIEVNEGYIETVVPLLKDSAIGNLEFNGAARRTHYSTSGSVTTWKVGGVFEPVSQVRLRGTLSRDIRAPNVNELFGSVTRSFSSFTDPATGQQSLIEIVSGANEVLRPEIADTYTIGLVLRPDFLLPALNLSFDYYDIKVDGAIGQVGSQTIANRCLSGATEFCPLITRNAAGQVTLINDRLQNVNGLSTRGLDIEASYRTSIGGDNSLDLRLLATKVFALTTTDSAGSTDRAGQTGFRASTTPGVPDWILDGIANLRLGPATITGHGRYIPKGKFNADFVGPEDDGYAVTLPNSINTNRVAGRFYADLTLTWAVDAGESKMEFFGAVKNLFDKDPPIAPSAVGITNQVLFDQIGRSYRIGVRVRR